MLPLAAPKLQDILQLWCSKYRKYCHWPVRLLLMVRREHLDLGMLDDSFIMMPTQKRNANEPMPDYCTQALHRLRCTNTWGLPPDMSAHRQLTDGFIYIPAGATASLLSNVKRLPRHPSLPTSRR